MSEDLEDRILADGDMEVGISPSRLSKQILAPSALLGTVGHGKSQIWPGVPTRRKVAPYSFTVFKKVGSNTGACGLFIPTPLRYPFQWVSC